ncbi:IS701 family transposase [Streptomyces sp. 7N604]|uniref:IS701 family transposase n=1 Tax=Streptomyces sp. 7N604 TaxID=3457415 RepID=UPI003FCF6FC0
MSAVAPDTDDEPSKTRTPPPTGSCEVVLTELCSALFTSLPRSDQRRKGLAYIRGLLGAQKRKSIRNIAALIGGQATEQSLHHFICDSTWEWAPVRRALARHLASTAPPQAWVVRPMVIPKAGERTVGVERSFFPDLGQVMNAQQAIGVWAATEEMSAPVNWRLHLSRAWLEDRHRRSQASIPDDVGVETLSECAAEAYLEMDRGWDLPVRPVVMDARDADAAIIVRKLRGARVPLLIRVSSTLRLGVSDPALHSRAEALTAHQIMGAARDMRRPVLWKERGPETDARTGLVAGVRVRMPSRHGRLLLGHAPRGGDLYLLGVGDNDRRWPTELWLTDLKDAQPAALLRLTRLIHRVDQDFIRIANQVGIRDFAGRSFRGWHRHVTLASAAHAVAALAGTSGELSYAS